MAASAREESTCAQAAPKTREDYDRAIAEGKRASIAEEERPEVFTPRIGNLLPGEAARIPARVVAAPGPDPLPFVVRSQLPLPPQPQTESKSGLLGAIGKALGIGVCKPFWK